MSNPQTRISAYSLAVNDVETDAYKLTGVGAHIAATDTTKLAFKKTSDLTDIMVIDGDAKTVTFASGVTVAGLPAAGTGVEDGELEFATGKAIRYDDVDDAFDTSDAVLLKTGAAIELDEKASLAVVAEGGGFALNVSGVDLVEVGCPLKLTSDLQFGACELKATSNDLELGGDFVGIRFGNKARMYLEHDDDTGLSALVFEVVGQTDATRRMRIDLAPVPP